MLETTGPNDMSEEITEVQEVVSVIADYVAKGFMLHVLAEMLS